MSKYKSPLSGNELWISQTYHTTGGNKAIDYGNTPAETPVYAMASGTIGTISTAQGSYLTLKVDNSPHILYCVHIYKFKVNQGQKVSQGQQIAVVAPKSANGGYDPHLHIGLQPQYNLMDYMDRSIVFRTRYQAIKDIWFNGENFNWSLHKDLSYDINTDMSYKKGDVIEFTGTQNIRQGSGTSYPSTGSTQIGQTATIINGPRTADNYTWWDVQITGGGTGWLADVGKWKIYVAPPQPPQTPPALTECQNKVKALESVIDSLDGELKAVKSDLKKGNEKVTTLESELKLEKNKVRIEQERAAHLEGVLKEERKEAGEIALRVEQLEETLTELKKEKGDLQEQLSKGSLVNASAGEMFAELWKRFVKSLDRKE